eukprot:2191665-Alexandrium_andersonii.AAC.1
MSASLVGSEMCIRDSLPTAHGPLLGSFGVGRHTRAPPLPRRGTGRCSGPVSYTHLTLPTICSV